MKQNRRGFLKSETLGSAGALALSSCQPKVTPLSEPTDYSVLDEILNKPVLKKELSKAPVITDNLELLRYDNNFLCKVRSTDEAIRIG